jgi:hypothetical protein
MEYTHMFSFVGLRRAMKSCRSRSGNDMKTTPHSSLRSGSVGRFITGLLASLSIEIIVNDLYSKVYEWIHSNCPQSLDKC